jgi:urea transport system substrate-binding protein
VLEERDLHRRRAEPAAEGLRPWLVKNFGKKFYLIGSNYIYPKEENNVCKILLKQLGGEVVGEEYVPLGHSEFSAVINKFKETQPNVIFSTVVGDSVVALHRQYKAAGLDPKKMPMASLTTSEEESGGDGRRVRRRPLHLGALTSCPTTRRRTTSSSRPSRSGGARTRSTNFVSEPAYFQVYLFKQAVEKLGKAAITPPDDPRGRMGAGDQGARGARQDRPARTRTPICGRRSARRQTTGSSRSSSSRRSGSSPCPTGPIRGRSARPTGHVEKKA